MLRVQTARRPAEAFRLAMDHVVETLEPERVVVLYGIDSGGFPFVRAARGVAPETVWTTGEISLELLREVLRSGVGTCLTDALQNPKYANRTSAVLAGLRSVLCTPVLNPQGKPAGLLYADSRIRVGAYSQTNLEWLAQLAQAVTDRVASLGEKALSPASEANWARVRETGVEAFRQGQYEAAEVALEEARDLAELWGLADVRLARSLNELGELYRAQQRLAQAEDVMLRAVAILEAHGLHEHPDLGACLNNLGGVLYARGEEVRSLEVFEQARVLWEKANPDHPQLVPILSNLATLCQVTANRRGVETYAYRALALSEKLHGAGHPNTLRCRDKLRELNLPEPR